MKTEKTLPAGTTTLPMLAVGENFATAADNHGHTSPDAFRSCPTCIEMQLTTINAAHAAMEADTAAEAASIFKTTAHLPGELRITTQWTAKSRSIVVYGHGTGLGMVAMASTRPTKANGAWDFTSAPTSIVVL